MSVVIMHYIREGIFSIAPYVALSMVIIFFHELGHYWAGRTVGAGIESFSVGFGRELVGYTSKLGVRWSLRICPLGGYVKFIGDADGSSRPDVDLLRRLGPEGRKTLLVGKSKKQRAFVLAAGPGANFLLALVVLSGYFFAYGRTDVRPLVASVLPGSAAQQAGILPGDVVLAIDGSKIHGMQDIRDAAENSAGRDMLVTVFRKGTELGGVVAARPSVRQGPFGKETDFLIGVVPSAAPGNRIVDRYTVFGAIAEGSVQTWRIGYMSVVSVANIIEGRTSLKNLSGPLKMIEVTGVMAKIGGFEGLIGLLAVISVSVGILNLLPIPVLDGGYLLMLVVEMLIGRPISDRAMDIFYRVGFVCLGSLAILLTTNDILSVLGN